MSIQRPKKVQPTTDSFYLKEENQFHLLVNAAFLTFAFGLFSIVSGHYRVRMLRGQFIHAIKANFDRYLPTQKAEKRVVLLLAITKIENDFPKVIVSRSRLCKSISVEEVTFPSPFHNFDGGKFGRNEPLRHFYALPNSDQGNAKGDSRSQGLKRAGGTVFHFSELPFSSIFYSFGNKMIDLVDDCFSTHL